MFMEAVEAEQEGDGDWQKSATRNKISCLCI
jgi:hypothetical protein